MDDQQIIENMYRQYWKCMIDKEADGLRAIMTELMCGFTGIPPK